MGSIEGGEVLVGLGTEGVLSDQARPLEVDAVLVVEERNGRGDGRDCDCDNRVGE